jgi:hypothetical protein
MYDEAINSQEEDVSFYPLSPQKIEQNFWKSVEALSQRDL